MAGLQQYNFFPTDLFYPRPQPSLESSKAVVLPLQTPKADIISTEKVQLQNQNNLEKSGSLMKVSSSNAALVFNQKKQTLNVVDKKELDSSVNSLSWLLCFGEEEEEEEGSEAS